jgi:hypothetical protein
MYTSVSWREVIERVEHIREPHRQIRATSEQGRAVHTQHERRVKDFISNLRRTAARPTANMVRDLADACSLATDGAYRSSATSWTASGSSTWISTGGRTHIEG